ncbi:MAG: alpha/beta fold hydrolase [Agitococcus sp.]|nr:alpha/beta fold hydrolase [Agitococcus sp.]
MSSLRHQLYQSYNPHAVNLMLVHGWGMNSEVWQPLLPYLQDDFHVTVIDGFEEDITAYLAIAPEFAIWCGWSLGGLLVLDIASQCPQRVQAVVTIACNPCFVQRDDWPCAMSLLDFQQFQQGLRENPSATLKRFIALQCLGSSSQKQDARFLQQQLAAQPLPTLSTLQAGLNLLEQDYRQQFAQLTLPMFCLFGENDGLVPTAVGDALLALNANVQLSIIADAAHVPFVSHPEKVAQQLGQFVQERLK